MSRSFNVSFTQTLKVTVSDVFIKEIRKQLTNAVRIISAIPVEKRLREQKVALVRADSLVGMDDEAMMQSFTKQAFRDGLREEFIELLIKAGDDELMAFSKFAPALVTVTRRES